MPLEMADAAALAKELRTLLREALPRPCAPLPLTLPPPGPGSISDKAKAQLATMGLHLGDRVVIAGQKVPDVFGETGTTDFCIGRIFVTGFNRVQNTCTLVACLQQQPVRFKYSPTDTFPKGLFFLVYSSLNFCVPFDERNTGSVAFHSYTKYWFWRVGFRVGKRRPKIYC